MIKIRNKYWRIAQRLQTEQLQKSRSEKYKFSDRDLFELDIGKRGSSFFLGFYSEEGLVLALTKYGVYDLLAQRGFKQIITEVDTTDPYKHRIALYNNSKSKGNLLIELVLRKYFFTLNQPYDSPFNTRNYTGLAIDWLLIQNINDRFSPEKPRLPGQRFPGMGLSSVVLELLLIICWRLNLAGLINVPEHYHNAYLYSKIFFYFDPFVQAKFLALSEKFKDLPLHKISWGIEWGCVDDLDSGKPLEWFVHHQLVPVHPDLQKEFAGGTYKRIVNREIKSHSFAFNEKKYTECKERYDIQNLEKCI
jgi:hypothetical protein